MRWDEPVEGLENDNFWTMSQTAIVRMVRTLNPEIWAMRKEFKEVVRYSEEEVEQIQRDSGIYRLGCPAESVLYFY